MKLLSTAAIAALVIALLITPALSQQGAQQGDRAAASAATADGSPLVSIRELMEQTITPVTNTLWNAWDPPTDEEWTALEEAAITMMVATQANALGGTGPNDSEWVSQPAWRAFNQLMLNATRGALDAIRARDHDALLEVGDALYTSCEACHRAFNPGVVDQ